MLSPRFKAVALILLAAVAFNAGCQSATGRTTGQYIDDKKITAELKAKLAAEKISNLTRVSVRTVDGIVYLTGIVDSPEQQARAVEIASTVPGVKNVVNHVQVAQK